MGVGVVGGGQNLSCEGSFLAKVAPGRGGGRGDELFPSSRDSSHRLL